MRLLLALVLVGCGGSPKPSPAPTPASPAPAEPDEPSPADEPRVEGQYKMRPSDDDPAVRQRALEQAAQVTAKLGDANLVVVQAAVDTTRFGVGWNCQPRGRGHIDCMSASLTWTGDGPHEPSPEEREARQLEIDAAEHWWALAIEMARVGEVARKAKLVLDPSWACDGDTPVHFACVQHREGP